MFSRIFDSSPVNVLERALTGSSLRHKAISNNIANVNTPGYKRVDVSFEQELAAASADSSRLGMTRTHPGHLAAAGEGTGPRITRSESTSLRTDGNNVDIDAEMAAMTKNNIYYNALAQRIGGYYTNIKSAIKGS